jgi:carbohydrate kinase (thermoresistant glucokinase family)
MKQGIRLKDEDRRPWLERLHSELKERLGRQESLILACSVLKERTTLSDQLPQFQLDANPIRDHLQHRVSHFFSKESLDSQFATLEKPKDAIIVDARKSPDEVVN